MDALQIDFVHHHIIIIQSECGYNQVFFSCVSRMNDQTNKKKLAQNISNQVGCLINEKKTIAF